MWYGPGVISEKPEVRIKKVEDKNNLILRHANPIVHPNTNIVDVCYDVYVIDKETGITKYFEEIHNMRYFFKPEIEYYLNVSGFELIQCIDCNTLKDPTFDTWTAYFIAKKI